MTISPMCGLLGKLLLGAACVAAVPASAAVSIVGGSSAGRDCYLAAEFKRETRASLDVCNRALDVGSITRRDRAATLVNRGIIHMQSRDLENAVADYKAAIELSPGLAEAHINLGIALLHRGGQDQAAIDALTRALDMKPERPEVALYTRAVAYEMIGNTRAAYDDYAAAAALAPEWKEPAEQLKRFSVERKSTARG
ncbi:tetratricopeptide repeat protein [Sandaracinobacter neustonicus]|uniref:Tetratricopeptide repeat protein n=1 Tax=Sandaracinobacter neustonicus TaxID=1715348 RepID=A0A501XNI5_9SPHN|nr:tetratricopeptide repeat protein [Sandaracinobacter neustonicus]TPE62136.1 tetratricopeptide repeat protein [Sandaracinobacter neustonicus]